MASIDELRARVTRAARAVLDLGDTAVMPTDDAGDLTVPWGSSVAHLRVVEGDPPLLTVFSVVLAGGGVKAGYVHGSSNSTASEPEEKAMGPEDLFTTAYHCLGIVADKELMAPGDRPIEIVDGGSVVKEILA